MGGPRGWVVSVGVLTLLCLLGGAGALVVDGGGGSSGAASVLPGDGPQSGSAGSGSPDGWTASTPTPALGLLSPAAQGFAPTSTAPSAALSTAPDAARSTAPNAASGAAGVAGVPVADREAGIATRNLVQVGTGRLLTVPGKAPAPGAAPRMTVRVEIEEGIGADGPAFAEFVLATLNDPRSWGHGGRLRFARTDGRADFRVILASPDTSARLCAPVQTRGTLSCGGGGKAVITMYRWMNGIPDYGDDRTGYRQYVVNHEVGHVLGHGHAYCDPGHLAPVMVQQTKGLRGCLPNPWPFPT